MEKQIVIYIKGGTVQNIKTNFECSYQIIDYDIEGYFNDDIIGDILEPDEILLEQEIFE